MGDKRMARWTATASNHDKLEVGEIVRRMSDIPGTPVFGVIANSGGAGSPALAELATGVAVAELRRRLGVSAIRAFVPGDRAAAVLGEVALALSPWDAPRAARLAGLVAFTDSELAPPIRGVVDDATEAGCPTQVVRTGPEAPDPVVLGFRLYAPQALEDRLEYLRVVGAVPEEGQFVFIDLSGPGTDCARQVVTARAEATGRSVVEVRPDALPIDLVSIVAAADLVVTDSPGTLTLALAGGRRAVGVTREGDRAWSPLVTTAPGMIVADETELAEWLQPASCQPTTPDPRDQLTRNGDAMFDQLSAALIDSGGSRLAQAVAGRIDDLIEERAAIEVVNAGLRARLTKERQAMAHYVRSLDDPTTGRGPLRLELAQAEHEAATQTAALLDAQAEVERLRAEIRRLYATRTMRAIGPARALYARLRARAR